MSNIKYNKQEKTRLTTDEKTGYVGVQLPLTNSPYGYFNPSITTEEQLKTNFKNLVLTIKGERLYRPEFGCENLTATLFENPNIEDIQEKINTEIRDKTSLYLPRIKINDIKVLTFNIDRNVLNVKIYYEVTPQIIEELTFNILGN